MNHTAMNNSIWTTNSQSLSDFEFSHFCRYFPFLFDSCGHILLISPIFCYQALEVTIKANIEQELTQVAVSKLSKPLKMVKPAGGKQSAKKKKGAGKKKK